MMWGVDTVFMLTIWHLFGEYAALIFGIYCIICAILIGRYTRFAEKIVTMQRDEIECLRGQQ